MVPSQEMTLYRLLGQEWHMRRKASSTKAIRSLSGEPHPIIVLHFLQEKIHRHIHDSRENLRVSRLFVDKESPGRLSQHSAPLD